MVRVAGWIVLAAMCAPSAVWSEEACVSGPEPGQRPKPYSSIIATGPHRGQSQCYICETGDLPAIIVFARTPSDPLGKLTQKLDRAVSDHKKDNLRGWVTFLSDDQPTMDPVAAEWGKKHAVRELPLGVFQDAVGPPAYRLSSEADVTVLLYVQQKVVANFAFRAGELNDGRIEEVLKAIPQLLKKD